MNKNSKRIFLIYLIPILFLHCDLNKSPISSTWSNGKIQLTNTGFDYEPYISPNGKYIAFRSARNTFNPLCSAILSELWIISNIEERLLVSKSDRDITSQGIVDVFDIDWFPDSKSMIAEIRVADSGYDKSEIWRIYLDGKKERITSPQNVAFKPNCSPDGSKIAFIRRDPKTTPQGSPIWHLTVVNPNGSNEIIVESGLCYDYTWTYDSEGLIYSKYDRNKNNYDLWYSSINGVDKYPISNTKFDETNPSCSFDGKYLAFTAKDTLFITSTQKFKPDKIQFNSYNPTWINNLNLLLVTYNENEYTETGDIKYWINESWIIDLSGNIIRKIEEGNHTRVSFSRTGECFAYSLNGNIWLDHFSNY